MHSSHPQIVLVRELRNKYEEYPAQEPQQHHDIAAPANRHELGRGGGDDAAGPGGEEGGGEEQRLPDRDSVCRLILSPPKGGAASFLMGPPSIWRHFRSVRRTGHRSG